MVTREEFESVQDILGGKHNTRPKTYNFPYKGPIICGECGAMITAENKVKRQKNGIERHYVYYHCTKRKDPNCSQKVIEEKKLEKQIAKSMLSIDIPEEFFNWAMTRLKEDNNREVKARKKIILNQQQKLGDLLQKIDNLIDLRASQEISAEEFKTRKAKLLQEKSRQESLVRNTNERTTEWFNNAEKYLTFAEDAYKRFKNGSLRTRKEMLFMLGSNLKLVDKKLFIIMPDMLQAIEKASVEVKQIHDRFEPQKTVDRQQFYSDLYSQSSVLLRGQDSNLRPIG
ncbi:recombinase zinc beta ribbon domain-containing protein [Candidatus Nomurabacteria bacterium]|nr:recombinase zinc beta ribbon domain-containing protein [Candidatus Nomurabacteria bacterium]